MGSPPAPLMALAAHGAEGGATLVGKLISLACRSHFNHLVQGSRCTVLNRYDGCDPDESDVCFHRDGRFSAGRHATRGYRFVHLVRSPLDVLTRSYLLAQPNATHTLNSTSLVTALEGHWKLLSSSVLHEMVDMAEGFESDPHALRVQVEDLISNSRANQTLARILGFLLDRSPNDHQITSLTSDLSAALVQHARLELLGEEKRKHLAKLLLHKPAKCQHVNKLSNSLGYDEAPCGDVKTVQRLEHRGSASIQRRLQALYNWQRQ